MCQSRQNQREIPWVFFYSEKQRPIAIAWKSDLVQCMHACRTVYHQSTHNSKRNLSTPAITIVDAVILAVAQVSVNFRDTFLPLCCCCWGVGGDERNHAERQQHHCVFIISNDGIAPMEVPFSRTSCCLCSSVCSLQNLVAFITQMASVRHNFYIYIECLVSHLCYHFPHSS
jgi:hypothetical protein